MIHVHHEKQQCVVNFCLKTVSNFIDLFRINHSNMCTHAHVSCTRTPHMSMHAELPANKLKMLAYIYKLFIKSNRSHLIHFTKQGEGIGAQRKKRNECSPHKKMQVTLASTLVFELYIYTVLYESMTSHFTNLRHTLM